MVYTAKSETGATWASRMDNITLRNWTASQLYDFSSILPDSYFKYGRYMNGMDFTKISNSSLESKEDDGHQSSMFKQYHYSRSGYWCDVWPGLDPAAVTKDSAYWLAWNNQGYADFATWTSASSAGDPYPTVTAKLAYDMKHLRAGMFSLLTASQIAQISQSWAIPLNYWTGQYFTGTFAPTTLSFLKKTRVDFNFNLLYRTRTSAFSGDEKYRYWAGTAVSRFYMDDIFNYANSGSAGQKVTTLPSSDGLDPLLSGNTTTDSYPITIGKDTVNFGYYYGQATGFADTFRVNVRSQDRVAITGIAAANWAYLGSWLDSSGNYLNIGDRKLASSGINDSPWAYNFFQYFASTDGNIDDNVDTVVIRLLSAQQISYIGTKAGTTSWVSGNSVYVKASGWAEVGVTFLGNLSGTQLALVSNLETFSNDELAALTPWQVTSGFIGQNWSSLSGAQLNKFAISTSDASKNTFAYLPTAAFKGLSTSALRLLDASHVAQIPLRAFDTMIADQINALGTRLGAVASAGLASHLTNSKLSQLGDSFFNGLLNGDFLNALTITQLGQIPSASFGQLSNAAVAGLNATTLARLSDAQLGAISNQQYLNRPNGLLLRTTTTGIDMAKLVANPLVDWSRITYYFLNQLSQANFNLLTPAIWRQIPVSVLGRLTLAQTQRLSESALNALSDNQFGVLKFVGLISTTLIKKVFTGTRVSGLRPYSFWSYVTPAMFNALSCKAETINGVAYSNVVARIPVAAISQLPVSVFAGIDTAHLEAFTNSQLANLTPNQFAAIDASKFLPYTDADGVVHPSRILTQVSLNTFKALQPTQIRRLYEFLFNTVDNNAFANVTEEQATANKEAFATLLGRIMDGDDGREKWLGNAVNMLLELNWLDADVVANIDLAQIQSDKYMNINWGWMSATFLNSISAEVFSALKPTNLVQINLNAMAGLDAEHIAALTATQIGAVFDTEGTQVAGLTAAQLSAMSSIDQLSAAAIAAITPTVLAASNINLAQRSSAFLNALTAQQYAALTAAQLAQFSDQQLMTLPIDWSLIGADTLNGLSSAQFRLLSSAAKVVQFSARAFAGLEAARWVDLALSVDSLTTSQVKTLRQQLLDGLLPAEAQALHKAIGSDILQLQVLEIALVRLLASLNPEGENQYATALSAVLTLRSQSSEKWTTGNVALLLSQLQFNIQRGKNLQVDSAPSAYFYSDLFDRQINQLAMLPLQSPTTTSAQIGSLAAPYLAFIQGAFETKFLTPSYNGPDGFAETQDPATYQEHLLQALLRFESNLGRAPYTLFSLQEIDDIVAAAYDAAKHNTTTTGASWDNLSDGEHYRLVGQAMQSELLDKASVKVLTAAGQTSINSTLVDSAKMLTNLGTVMYLVQLANNPGNSIGSAVAQLSLSDESRIEYLGKAVFAALQQVANDTKQSVRTVGENLEQYLRGLGVTSTRMASQFSSFKTELGLALGQMNLDALLSSGTIASLGNSDLTQDAVTMFNSLQSRLGVDLKYVLLINFTDVQDTSINIADFLYQLKTQIISVQNNLDTWNEKIINITSDIQSLQSNRWSFLKLKDTVEHFIQLIAKNKWSSKTDVPFCSTELSTVVENILQHVVSELNDSKILNQNLNDIPVNWKTEIQSGQYAKDFTLLQNFDDKVNVNSINKASYFINAEKYYIRTLFAKNNVHISLTQAEIFLKAAFVKRYYQLLNNEKDIQYIVESADAEVFGDYMDIAEEKIYEVGDRALSEIFGLGNHSFLISSNDGDIPKYADSGWANLKNTHKNLFLSLNGAIKEWTPEARDFFINIATQYLENGLHNNQLAINNGMDNYETESARFKLKRYFYNLNCLTPILSTSSIDMASENSLCAKKVLKELFFRSQGNVLNPSTTTPSVNLPSSVQKVLLSALFDAARNGFFDALPKSLINGSLDNQINTTINSVIFAPEVLFSRLINLIDPDVFYGGVGIKFSGQIFTPKDTLNNLTITDLNVSNGSSSVNVLQQEEFGTTASEELIKLTGSQKAAYDFLIKTQESKKLQYKYSQEFLAEAYHVVCKGALQSYLKANLNLDSEIMIVLKKGLTRIYNYGVNNIQGEGKVSSLFTHGIKNDGYALPSHATVSRISIAMDDTNLAGNNHINTIASSYKKAVQEVIFGHQAEVLNSMINGFCIRLAQYYVNTVLTARNSGGRDSVEDVFTFMKIRIDNLYSQTLEESDISTNFFTSCKEFGIIPSDALPTNITVGELRYRLLASAQQADINGYSKNIYKNYVSATLENAIEKSKTSIPTISQGLALYPQNISFYLTRLGENIDLTSEEIYLAKQISLIAKNTSNRELENAAKFIFNNNSDLVSNIVRNAKILDGLKYEESSNNPAYENPWSNIESSWAVGPAYWDYGFVGDYGFKKPTLQFLKNNINTAKKNIIAKHIYNKTRMEKLTTGELHFEILKMQYKTQYKLTESDIIDISDMYYNNFKTNRISSSVINNFNSNKSERFSVVYDNPEILSHSTNGTSVQASINNDIVNRSIVVTADIHTSIEDLIGSNPSNQLSLGDDYKTIVQTNSGLQRRNAVGMALQNKNNGSAEVNASNFSLQKDFLPELMRMSFSAWIDDTETLRAVHLSAYFDSKNTSVDLELINQTMNDLNFKARELLQILVLDSDTGLTPRQRTVLRQFGFVNNETGWSSDPGINWSDVLTRIVSTNPNVEASPTLRTFKTILRSTLDAVITQSTTDAQKTETLKKIIVKIEENIRLYSGKVIRHIPSNTEIAESLRLSLSTTEMQQTSAAEILLETPIVRSMPSINDEGHIKPSKFAKKIHKLYVKNDNDGIESSTVMSPNKSTENVENQVDSLYKAITNVTDDWKVNSSKIYKSNVQMMADSYENSVYGFSPGHGHQKFREDIIQYLKNKYGKHIDITEDIINQYSNDISHALGNNMHPSDFETTKSTIDHSSLELPKLVSSRSAIADRDINDFLLHSQRVKSIRGEMSVSLIDNTVPPRHNQLNNNSDVSFNDNEIHLPNNIENKKFANRMQDDDSNIVTEINIDNQSIQPQVLTNSDNASEPLIELIMHGSTSDLQNNANANSVKPSLRKYHSMENMTRIDDSNTDVLTDMNGNIRQVISNKNPNANEVKNLSRWTKINNNLMASPIFKLVYNVTNVLSIFFAFALTLAGLGLSIYGIVDMIRNRKDYTPNQFNTAMALTALGVLNLSICLVGMASGITAAIAYKIGNAVALASRAANFASGLGIAAAVIGFGLSIAPIVFSIKNLNAATDSNERDEAIAGVAFAVTQSVISAAGLIATLVACAVAGPVGWIVGIVVTIVALLLPNFQAIQQAINLEKKGDKLYNKKIWGQLWQLRCYYDVAQYCAAPLTQLGADGWSDYIASFYQPYMTNAWFDYECMIEQEFAFLSSSEFVNRMDYVAIGINYQGVSTLGELNVQHQTLTHAYSLMVTQQELRFWDSKDYTKTVRQAYVTEYKPANVRKPVLYSASVDGTQLSLCFDRQMGGLGEMMLPLPEQFTVMADGTRVLVRAIMVNGNGDVVLTLTNSIIQNQIVTFSYIAPSASNETHALQDPAGYRAPSYTNHIVQNRKNSSQTAPQLVDAYFTSTYVRLVFDQLLDTDGVQISTSSFTVNTYLNVNLEVQDDNPQYMPVDIESVNIKGQIVELELASLSNSYISLLHGYYDKWGSGNRMDVSYNPPSNHAIKSVSENGGLKVGNFTVSNHVANEDTAKPNLNTEVVLVCQAADFNISRTGYVSGINTEHDVIISGMHSGKIVYDKGFDWTISRYAGSAGLGDDVLAEIQENMTINGNSDQVYNNEAEATEIAKTRYMEKTNAVGELSYLSVSATKLAKDIFYLNARGSLGQNIFKLDTKGTIALGGWGTNVFNLERDLFNSLYVNTQNPGQDNKNIVYISGNLQDTNITIDLDNLVHSLHILPRPSYRVYGSSDGLDKIVGTTNNQAYYSNGYNSNIELWGKYAYISIGSGATAYLNGINAQVMLNLALWSQFKMLPNQAAAESIGRVKGNFGASSFINLTGTNFAEELDGHVNFKNSVNLLPNTSAFVLRVNASAPSTDQQTETFGTSVDIKSMSIKGNSVILTLNKAVSNGQWIGLSYNRPANTNDVLQDLLGNVLTSFNAATSADGEGAVKHIINRSGADISPAVMQASVNGNTITLCFSESLQTNSALLPKASAFLVTINDVKVQVTALSVFDKRVQLTLSHVTVSNDILNVAYSDISDTQDDDAGVLQSINTGLDVKSFVKRAYNVLTATSPPILQDATINGNLLALNFSEPLDATCIPVNSDYIVTVNHKTVNVTSALVKDSGLLLSLKSPVIQGSVVKISYIPGSNNGNLYSLSNQAVASWNSINVSNQTGIDTIPPLLKGAQLVGNTLTLAFSEALDTTYYHIPKKSVFAVNVDGIAINISSVAYSNNLITLTLDSSVEGGKPVQIGYTASDSQPHLRDLAGLELADFSGLSVRNLSRDITAPTIMTAVVKGNILTITFSEFLDLANLPQLESLRVKCGGQEIPIVNSSIEDAVLTLNLAVAVAMDAVVTLSYTRSSNSDSNFQDSSGNQVVTINNRSVVNITGKDITAPVLVDAKANDTKVVLTMSENLITDTLLIPGLSNFTVYVNDTKVNLALTNALTISDNTITLTLADHLTANDSVKVSYTSPTMQVHGLFDVYGNVTSAFNAQVINRTPMAPPKLETVVVDGYNLMIMYDQTLDTTAAGLPPESSFIVKLYSNLSAMGTEVEVSTVAAYNKTLMLTLVEAVARDKTVRVSYTKPLIADTTDFALVAKTGFIRNIDNAKADSFADIKAKNLTATAQVQTVKVNGTNLSFVLSQPLSLRDADKPVLSSFDVLVDGVSVTPEAITLNPFGGTLVLPRAVTSEQSVTFAYTNNNTITGNTETHRLRDFFGYDVGSFSCETVINITPSVPNTAAPSLVQTIVDGDQIILTYDKALAVAQSLLQMDFSVVGAVDANGNPLKTGKVNASGFVNFIGSNTNGDTYDLGDQSQVEQSQRLAFLQLGNGTNNVVTYRDTTGMVLSTSATGNAIISVMPNAALTLYSTLNYDDNLKPIMKSKVDQVLLYAGSNLQGMLNGNESIDARESSSTVSAEIGVGKHQFQFGGQSFGLMINRVDSITTIKSPLTPYDSQQGQLLEFKLSTTSEIFIGRESDGTLVLDLHMLDAANGNHDAWVYYDGGTANVRLNAYDPIDGTSKKMFNINKLVETLGRLGFASDISALSNKRSIVDASSIRGFNMNLYRMTDIVNYTQNHSIS